MAERGNSFEAKVYVTCHLEQKKYHKMALFLKMTLSGKLLLWEVLLRVSSVCLKRIQHSSLRILKKEKKSDEKI